MIAVLIAAGTGRRLSPLTDTIPKPMVTVGGLTLVEHFFAVLPNTVSEVVVVLGNLGDILRSHIGDRVGNRTIRYQYQGSSSGSMGALMALGHFTAKPFLVFNCDSIHCSSSVQNVAEIPNSYLVVQVSVTDAEYMYPDSTRTILTNGSSNGAGVSSVFLNAGCYCLTPEILTAEPKKVAWCEEFGLPETMIGLSEVGGPRFNPVVADFWLPVGTHRELQIANSLVGYRWLPKKINGQKIK